MQYEWDQRKAINNLKKHDVDFADAATVLDDEMALTILDDYVEEERFLSMGMDALSRVLVVIFTWRGDRIRIISARKATPREQNQYEE
ncbi:MAG: BrnT family toxin [Deltaproteobacteria bacterium]|nr:BrnT family toxin [Deltaproteobacteria bacterium]